MTTQRVLSDEAGLASPARQGRIEPPWRFRGASGEKGESLRFSCFPVVLSGVEAQNRRLLPHSAPVSPPLSDTPIVPSVDELHPCGIGSWLFFVPFGLSVLGRGEVYILVGGLPRLCDDETCPRSLRRGTWRGCSTLVSLSYFLDLVLGAWSRRGLVNCNSLSLLFFIRS